MAMLTKNVGGVPKSGGRNADAYWMVCRVHVCPTCAEAVPARLKLPNTTSTCAPQELKLNYHNPKTILISISILS